MRVELPRLYLPKLFLSQAQQVSFIDETQRKLDGFRAELWQKCFMIRDSLSSKFKKNCSSNDHINECVFSYMEIQYNRKADPVEFPVIVKFNKKDKSELYLLIRAITALS